MQEFDQEYDDEITLLDLFAVLWSHRALIICITLFCMVGSIAFSFASLRLPSEKSPLPNKYTPTAEMLINSPNASGSSSLSSMINASGLGSIAGLAGTSQKSNQNSALAEHLLVSNDFLDSVVDTFGLIEKWKVKKSPRTNTREQLKKLLKTKVESDSGVFTVSYTDTDPAFARDVVEFAVDYLETRFAELGLDNNLREKKNLEENIATSYNEILRLQEEISNVEQSVANLFSATSAPSIMLDMSMLRLELSAQEEVYKQLKSQYELLKISMASEAPIFQILQRPEVPDMKSAPSRGKLCVIVTFAGAFVSVFLAFFLNAISNIKEDPVAMAKLKAANGKKADV